MMSDMRVPVAFTLHFVFKYNIINFVKKNFSKNYVMRCQDCVIILIVAEILFIYKCIYI